LSDRENQKASDFAVSSVTIKKGICIAPIQANAKTAEEAEAMFNSHVWELVKTEPQYSNKGVLIRMDCSKCGAHKIAILESP
jgi:hypothetical protein